MLLILSFPRNSPAFDFSYEFKSRQATLDLPQLRVNSLWNNLHFITHFKNRGQIPDRLQPIKEPSLKQFHFLIKNWSSQLWTLLS